MKNPEAIYERCMVSPEGRNLEDCRFELVGDEWFAIPNTIYYGNPDNERGERLTEARLHENGAVVFLGATVANATIGPRSVIYEAAILGQDVFIGKDCEITGQIGEEVRIEDKVVISHGAKVGNGSIIHSRVEIGPLSTLDEDVLIDGDIVLEMDVHIGSNTMVERGTRIGEHAQIGDNVNIGRDSVLADSVIVRDGASMESFAQIGERATIGQSAILGKSAHIGPGAVIERDVKIGDYVGVAKHALVEEGRKIRDKTYVFPQFYKRGVRANVDS